MTFKQYLSSLTIIHAALMMGQLIFAAVVFVLVNQGLMADGEMADLRGTFLFLVPLLVISGVSAAVFIPRMKLSSIQEKDRLGQKLVEYRTLSIIKYALMEGPSLVAIVAYMLTGEMLFLGLSGVIIVLFFLERPHKQKIEMDLALSGEEKSALNNSEDTII